MRFCASAILRVGLCGVCMVGPSVAPHPKAQSEEMRNEKGVVLPSTDRILHRLELSDRREVVVVRRAIAPVSAIDDLLPPKFFKQGDHVPIGLFEIDIELRLPDGPALRLWSSRRHVVYAEVPEDADDDRVLDMCVVSDRVVSVMANRSGISLLDIPFHGQPREAWLNVIHWRLLAAPIPLQDGRLAAKLSYDERAETLEVYVTDSLQSLKLHSTWRQKDKSEWTFDLLKRWEEKVPATAP